MQEAHIAALTISRSTHTHTGELESTCKTIIKTPNDGMPFGRMAYFPPADFQEAGELNWSSGKHSLSVVVSTAVTIEVSFTTDVYSKRIRAALAQGQVYIL